MIKLKHTDRTYGFDNGRFLCGLQEWKDGVKKSYEHCKRLNVWDFYIKAKVMDSDLLEALYK